MHIRCLEGSIRPTETRGATKLLATADRAANSARVHRKGHPRPHQLKTGWYAFHVIQPSYNQLRAFERLLSAPMYDRMSDPFDHLLHIDSWWHWTLETTYCFAKSFSPASMVRPYHGFTSSLKTSSIHSAMSLRYLLATTYVLHTRSII